MDLFEEMVMLNLCARYPGELFFCPQFAIGNWSCPDFLILYPKMEQVWLVEVSGSATPKNLAAKVKDKQRQWIDPLLLQLNTSVPMAVAANWKIFVKVFIRQDAIRVFEQGLGLNEPGKRPLTDEGLHPMPDVSIYPSDSMAYPWKAWGRKLRDLSEKTD